MSKTPRRFLPKPTETTSRSSRNNKHHESSELPGSDLADGPHCVEKNKTIIVRPENKKKTSTSMSIMESSSSTIKSADGTPDGGTMAKQYRPRKFTPQLMETARHSFRRERAPINPDKCLESSKTLNSTAWGYSTNPTHESLFSYSSILRRQEARRHSFRVPDLPAIPSSCSGGSSDSESPRVSGGIPAILLNSTKEASNAHEAQFPEYIFSMTEHSPENQLKEQALAAFPNEQVYQPVDHFAIDREEDEFTYTEEPIRYNGKPDSTYRRASSVDLPWELEHLRRHKEEVWMNKRQGTAAKGSRFSRGNLRASNSINRTVNSNDGRDRDRDIAAIRRTNRPPMLGSDLIFPQSLTPDTTICEGNEFADNTHECRQSFYGFPGLWSANPRPSGTPDVVGLWMGTCKKDPQNSKPDDSLLPGILTPRRIMDGKNCRRSSELSKAHSQVSYHNAKSPDNNTDVVKQELNTPEQNDLEFHDGFVTQIYNYLSLGYPSVARYYDHELSKVTGVSVATLREDDLKTDATGHVSIKGTTIDGGIGKNVCMRWVALRLYIHEWVGQQPQMIMDADSNHGTWGVRERKGSWAI